MTVTRYPEGASSLDGLGDVAVSTASRGQIIAHNGALFRNRSQGVFDVRDWGAIGDGVTDDLTAFRAVAAAAKTAGGGDILIPPGEYLFSSSTTSGGIVWQWAIEGDNIRIVFARGAKIVSAVASARVVIAYGSAKPAGMANWATNEYRDATAYSLTGTATKGSRTVTTTTAAEAGNLAAGDLVYVRTGQTVSTGADTEPTSEINVVSAVDAGTGVVTLRFPLAHAYAAENYNSGSTGISSVGGGGSAAPYKISKVTDRTLLNFGLVNPVIECSGSVLQALSVWGVYGFRWTGGNLLVPKNGFGARDVREADCSGFVVERRDDGTRAYLFGPSTGCTHWNAHDFHLKSDGDGYLHIHEDVAQSRFHHFTVNSAAFDGTDPCIDIRARATDVSVTDWTVLVQNASDANAVFVADAPSSGKLARGKIVAGNSTANVRVDVDGWTIDDLTTSSGRIGLRAPQIGKGHETGTRVLSGWVYGTTGAQQFTPALGTLPRHAIPLRATLYVQTAFNSDGTDNISLGYSGTTNAYFTNTDVSTIGVKTPTAGANLLIPEPTADRTVVATYTAGGSTPTTGRAFVTLEYALAARID